jgi:type VI secretion system secreted protein Hcp
MALVSYLKMTGLTHGPIRGGCAQQGHENAILVYGLQHQVEIPRDPRSGLPAGKRIYQPLVLTKQVDCATPIIQNACAIGEKLAEVVIEFYRITSSGMEELYFKIKLENAIIVSARIFKPLTFLEENKPYHDMEELALAFEKIVISYVPAGIEAEDYWTLGKTSGE